MERSPDAKTTLGKQHRPWSHLIQIKPGRTHSNQANASARKKHRRRYGRDSKFAEVQDEALATEEKSFEVLLDGEWHAFATEEERDTFMAEWEARKYRAM